MAEIREELEQLNRLASVLHPSDILRQPPCATFRREISYLACSPPLLVPVLRKAIAI